MRESRIFFFGIDRKKRLKPRGLRPVYKGVTSSQPTDTNTRICVRILCQFSDNYTRNRTHQRVRAEELTRNQDTIQTEYRTNNKAIRMGRNRSKASTNNNTFFIYTIIKKAAKLITTFKNKEYQILNYLKPLISLRPTLTKNVFIVTTILRRRTLIVKTLLPSTSGYF